MPAQGLSPDVRNSLSQLTDKLPADATPGVSVTSDQNLRPDSAYLKQLQKFSNGLKRDARAYYNASKREKGPRKRHSKSPRKVISTDGFPPDISITYAAPPPQAFYSVVREREVNFFVMHSFGHGWHATPNRKGWMNSSRGSRGVVPIEDGNRTIYIPKGSDPVTLENFTRFAAGLRACLHSAARASAHFFIDRVGNLVIIGNCNDVLFTTKGLNKVQLGVEMEEAFYVLKDTKSQRAKATWKPGGKPKGTAGNVEYFSYSPQQLLTLSVLVKKLEVGYPNLRARNVYLDQLSMDKNSPPGYTMHNAVKGNSHIDISPHFLEQSLWDSFFALVDTHTHINPTNVFRTVPDYPGFGELQIIEPTSNTVTSAMTERLLQGPKDQGDALTRALSLAETTRQSVNNSSGRNANQAGLQISQQLANTSNVAQGTEELPAFPAELQTVDSDGNQTGSDPWVG